MIYDVHRGFTAEKDPSKDTRVISTEQSFVPKHKSRREYWTFGEDRSQFGWSESVIQERKQKSQELVYNYKLSKGLIVEVPKPSATASPANEAAKNSQISGASSVNMPFSSKTLSNNPSESDKSRSVRRLLNLEASDLKLEGNVSDAMNELKQTSESNTQSMEGMSNPSSLSMDPSHTESKETAAKAASSKAQKKHSKANLWKSRSSKGEPIQKQPHKSKAKPESSSSSLPKQQSDPSSSSLPKQQSFSSSSSSPLPSNASPIQKRIEPFSNDTFQLVLVTSVETFGKSELSLPTNNTLAMFSFFQRHFSFRALIYTNSKRVKRACDALGLAYDSHYECRFTAI